MLCAITALKGIAFGGFQMQNAEGAKIQPAKGAKKFLVYSTMLTRAAV